MKAEIIFVNNDFSITVGAEFSWDGKKVNFKSNKHQNLKSIMHEGFTIKGKHYTEKDGEDFVKLLPMAFHGSRMRARLVK